MTRRARPRAAPVPPDETARALMLAGIGPDLYNDLSARLRERISSGQLLVDVRTARRHAEAAGFKGDALLVAIASSLLLSHARDVRALCGSAAATTLLRRA